MDMARALPILCQFGIGAVLCVIGTWAGWRSGYLDMNLPKDRRAIVIVVTGFVGLLLFSCAFTFWLPYLPAEAAP